MRHEFTLSKPPTAAVLEGFVADVRARVVADGWQFRKREFLFSGRDIFQEGYGKTIGGREYRLTVFVSAPDDAGEVTVEDVAKVCEPSQRPPLSG